MFNRSNRVTNETSCALSISAVHTIGEAFQSHSGTDGTISEVFTYNVACCFHSYRSQILYAVAVSPHELDQLDRLSGMVTTHLLIDNIAHLWTLSSYKRLDTNKERPWSVFIKLDILEDLNSAGMKELLAAVESAPKIELRGFLVQSYAPSTTRQPKPRSGNQS